MDKSSFLTDVRKQTENDVEQYKLIAAEIEWRKLSLKHLAKRIKDSNAMLSSNGETPVIFED
jgi:ribosome-binding protein aMBF1 (putative translation factor)